MGAIPEAQPILTRRTAEILRGALSDERVAALNGLVQEAIDHFGRFLGGEPTGDLETDFDLTVARFHGPRVRIVDLLLGAPIADEVGDLLRSAAQAATDVLEQNVWKLTGADTAALRKAFRTYQELTKELTELITAPPSGVREPFALVQRSTRMDFCLSAALSHLEGDLPGRVDSERVTFLCRTAERVTIDVLEAVRSVRLAADPGALAAWREERLDRLAGSWGDEPGMDEELAAIYESRRDLPSGK